MRRWCIAILVAAFAAVALAALAAPRAIAQTPGPGDSNAGKAAGGDKKAGHEYLLVARNGSLWRLVLPPYNRKSWNVSTPAEKDLHAVELVRLPASMSGPNAGAITRVEVFSNGRLVVIETSDGVAFARLPELPAGDETSGTSPGSAPAATSAVTATAVPCVGSAHLSPDGRCIVCRDRRGQITLHRLIPSLTSTVVPTRSQHLGFIDARHIVITDDRGVWKQSIVRPTERTLLASEVPDGPMLISPDGKRAIGVFHEDDGKGQEPGDGASEKEPETALYVFRLDGKGVKRRLLEGATPISWSRDSRWVIAQMGTRACMARAIGGQYKCWRDYRAVALAPDDSTVLLAHPADGKSDSDPDHNDLYRGHREGVSPEQPRPLIRVVTGPATWLPGPE